MPNDREDNVVRFPDGEPLKGWRPMVAATAPRRRRRRVRWGRLALIALVVAALAIEAARDIMSRWRF